MNETKFNKERITERMKYLKGILDEGFSLKPHETMGNNTDEVILLLSILDGSTVGLGEHISKRSMDNIETLYCDIFGGISTLLIPADAEESVKKVLEDSVFTDRERLVIQRYYLDEEPKTMSVIGYEIGVSHSRVGQIRAKALRKMRNPKNSKILTYGIEIINKAESMRKELAETYIAEEVAEEISIAKARTAAGVRKQLLETSIDELLLSVRAYNCLRRAGIDTIGDLVNKTEADLQKVRNLGRKSIEEIKNILADKGLRIKTEEEAEKERRLHEENMEKLYPMHIKEIKGIAESGMVDIFRNVYNIRTVGDLMKLPEKVISGFLLAEKTAADVIDTIKQMDGEFAPLGAYSWSMPSIYDFDMKPETFSELKSRGISTLRPFFEHTGPKVTIDTYDDLRKNVIQKYLSVGNYKR